MSWSGADFPVVDLRLLASPRSAGKSLGFVDRIFQSQRSSKIPFAGIDLVSFQRWRWDGKAIRTHRAAGWSGSDR